MIKERHFEREGRGRRGPWGPPLGGWRGQHRHSGRARRGDVRAAILALLAERPMHGYEVIRELGERTGGVWQPSPGSVYPTLQMLEDEGLVSVEEADGRKRYTLTDQGRTEAERRSSDTTPWDEVTQGADPGTMDLRRAVFQTLGAVRQVAENGTPEQIERVRQLLVETRKRLYSILAEEE
jgi:DNA-binding PadR family transcriptional regulator